MNQCVNGMLISVLMELFLMVFPSLSDWSVTLTLHPLLGPWSIMGSTITLLPQWAIRPVQNFIACTRVHFIFSPFLLCLELSPNGCHVNKMRI